MYIGQLAKLSGVSPKAIRHYEALGILNNIERQGSYRVYQAHHITIIKMIRVAQDLGFKLKDIKPLIDEKYRSQQFPLEVAQQAMQQKKSELAEQISLAKQKIKEIEQLEKELFEMFSS